MGAIVTPRFDIGACTQYIADLVAAGGPTASNHESVEAVLRGIHTACGAGAIGPGDLQAIRHAFGDALGPRTLPGRSLAKRFGYPGDFEVIDDIHRTVVTDDPHLRRWDEFFHRHAAARAVRNRKTFFHRLLVDGLLRDRGDQPLRVLDLASGPCRDIAEFLDAYPHVDVQFTCVEPDPRAIAHARRVCARWSDRLQFVPLDAVRRRAPERFDLVWSAGLFDDVDDRRFVRLLARLLPLAHPRNGEVVIGNFGDANPSLASLAVCCDWHPVHRSRADLLRLAAACGARPPQVVVECEPEGINLFLRIDRSRTPAAVSAPRPPQ